MRQGRFCDFYHKIAPVFVQKNKSKYDRIAVRSDVSIGDGQIAAQLIFVHAVGQRHRYAAAAAGQTAGNKAAETNNRNMKNLFMNLSLKIRKYHILYRLFR